MNYLANYDIIIMQILIAIRGIKMDNEEITISSTSNKTADMTPIVILDETTRTQVRFELQQIDNEKAPEKKIKGKFIYTVANKKTGNFNDIIRLNKRSIKAGESFELSLSCKETYHLWQHLTERYKLVEGKLTPLGEVKYVRKDEDYEKLKSILKNKSELAELLSNADLSNINFALNVENLKRVKREIEQNLENDDEVKYWQPFFKNNAWILSQMFNAPFMIMKDCNYVGGKSLNNKHGKFTDFIYQNKVSKNISLIEIKTPTVNLTQATEYRADVHSASQDLSGAIAQLLTQKDELYKEYATLRLNTDSNFEALNVRCVLLVGNYSKLSKSEKKCFEIYRNELRAIEIICFDELLAKISLMLDLFEDKKAPANDNSDLPF